MNEYSCVICRSSMRTDFVYKYPLCPHCRGLNLRIVVQPLRYIAPHPIAKKLRIAYVEGYQVVVGDHYDEGTLGFFIQPGVVVPEQLLEDMWLKGKLSGKGRNTVTEREVAGISSDGLFYGSRFFTYTPEGLKVYESARNWKQTWREGDDIGHELGLTVHIDALLPKRDRPKKPFGYDHWSTSTSSYSMYYD